jgi:hypothetical protein
MKHKKCAAPKPWEWGGSARRKLRHVAVGRRRQGQLVLEVGSPDINGSIRSTFADCDYTGADL